MIQMLYCEKCGTPEIALNAISVDISLNKNEWCKCCNTTKNEKQNHFFCSIGCFMEYMKDLIKNKKKLEWETE